MDNFQKNVAWLKSERGAEIMECPRPLTHLICERNENGEMEAMPCSTEFLQTPPEEFKARFGERKEELFN